MNIQRLVLPVVAFATISTTAFAEVGSVGKVAEFYPLAAAMGTPIGPNPHLARGIPTPRFDPELDAIPAGAEIGVGQPEYIAQGGTTNPVPHLRRSNPWMRFDPESGGTPGIGELGAGEPETILAGSTSNPVPHFQPPLFLIGLELEIESSPDTYENLFVEQVAGAFCVFIDGF